MHAAQRGRQMMTALTFPHCLCGDTLRPPSSTLGQRFLNGSVFSQEPSGFEMGRQFGPEKMTETHPQTLGLKSSLVWRGPASGSVLKVYLTNP